MGGEFFWDELQTSGPEKCVGCNSGSFSTFEAPYCLSVAEGDPFLFDCMLLLDVIYHLAVVLS